MREIKYAHGSMSAPGSEWDNVGHWLRSSVCAAADHPEGERSASRRVSFHVLFQVDCGGPGGARATFFDFGEIRP